ncbi:tyrosine-type recombinase/integrase [Sinorhizobium meliloti]|uniref:tyrosine-type recombinase/integrase n=1 Tax=Rhizobium meliloti TaxID=382 RepID=UPI00186590A4|nr:site-specific integrase [Sinorhizobium meliloti]
MPSERKTTDRNGKAQSKWIVYYVGLDGKRNSKSFDQKAKALAFEKQTKSDRANKAPKITKGQLTYGDLVDRFVQDSSVGRDGGEPWKESTLDVAEQRFQASYQFLPRDTPLKTVTVAFMKDVRRSLQESTYARTTQIGVWNLIKSAFNYGYGEELISSNPVQTLVIRHQKVMEAGEEKFEVFTKEEASAIVAKALELSTATNGHTRRAFEFNWLIAPLLFETGMRIAELLALEWSNVDLEEQTISIRQTFIKQSKELQKVKAAASHRTLSISTALCRRLRQLKERRESRFVFETKTKEALQYRNTLRWWHSLLEHAGVREGGFHKARHYYASRLIEAGVDAKVLTTNLGHADVAFTLQVYGHLFDDRDTREKKRQVAEQLSMLAA